jgi:hypothetical protein
VESAAVDKHERLNCLAATAATHATTLEVRVNRAIRVTDFRVEGMRGFITHKSSSLTSPEIPDIILQVATSQLYDIVAVFLRLSSIISEFHLVLFVCSPRLYLFVSLCRLCTITW